MDPLRRSISDADFTDFHDFIESSSAAVFDTVSSSLLHFIDSSLQVGSVIEMHRLVWYFHLLYSNGFEAWMLVMV